MVWPDVFSVIDDMNVKLNDGVCRNSGAAKRHWFVCETSNQGNYAVHSHHFFDKQWLILQAWQIIPVI